MRADARQHIVRPGEVQPVPAGQKARLDAVERRLARQHGVARGALAALPPRGAVEAQQQQDRPVAQRPEPPQVRRGPLQQAAAVGPGRAAVGAAAHADMVAPAGAVLVEARHVVADDRPVRQAHVEERPLLEQAAPRLRKGLPAVRRDEIDAVGTFVLAAALDRAVGYRRADGLAQLQPRRAVLRVAPAHRLLEGKADAPVSIGKRRRPCGKAGPLRRRIDRLPHGVRSVNAVPEAVQNVHVRPRSGAPRAAVWPRAAPR